MGRRCMSAEGSARSVERPGVDSLRSTPRMGCSRRGTPAPTLRCSPFAVSSDVVYAAGRFSSIGGGVHRGLAALDSAGHAAVWDVGADGDVDALTVVGDRIYVGGGFSTIGGKSREYLASVNAGDGTATAWDPAPDDVVRSIAVSPDRARLVVVGDFQQFGGRERDVGEFDLATGVATEWQGWAPFLGYAVAFDGNGRLYV